MLFLDLFLMHGRKKYNITYNNNFACDEYKMDSTVKKKSLNTQFSLDSASACYSNRFVIDAQQRRKRFYSSMGLELS